MAQFLESAEDLEWLHEVHGVSVQGYACAILHGNEDSPERVEVFARNHYRCKPTIWEADDEEVLRLMSWGLKPKF